MLLKPLQPRDDIRVELRRAVRLGLGQITSHRQPLPQRHDRLVRLADAHGRSRHGRPSLRRLTAQRRQRFLQRLILRVHRPHAIEEGHRLVVERRLQRRGDIRRFASRVPATIHDRWRKLPGRDVAAQLQNGLRQLDIEVRDRLRVARCLALGRGERRDTFGERLFVVRRARQAMIVGKPDDLQRRLMRECPAPWNRTTPAHTRAPRRTRRRAIDRRSAALVRSRHARGWRRKKDWVRCGDRTRRARRSRA